MVIHVLLFLGLYFEVFLLITFLGERPRTEKLIQHTIRRYPSVSIIVPCYNEERTITKTILSLLSLDYPEDKLRIVVVNDGSTDGSADMLARFSSHPQVTIFHKENGGKHSALNFALTYVQTELVGGLDADSFVDTRALKEMVPYFDEEKVMAVTPAIKIFEPRNVVQRIQKAEYELSIFFRKTFAFLDGLLVTPGPLSIFRVTVFEELGGYRAAHNTEDFEIALRMQSNHYKIENAHRAHVYTVGPQTFKKLFKQRLRWTYGFIKNIMDYRHLYFKKRYGNFGMFILPLTTLSLFSALYFTVFFIISIVNRTLTKIVEFQAVGLGLTGNFSFEWFYVNTQSFLFLTYILATLTFFLIMAIVVFFF